MNRLSPYIGIGLAALAMSADMEPIGARNANPVRTKPGPSKQSVAAKKARKAAKQARKRNRK